MHILDILKLTTAKKARHEPPIVLRRRKLASMVWEQIQLARSHAQGTPFTITKFKSLVDRETGMRKQIEIPKRIKAWWFANEQGRLCVSIRYRIQLIELAKGKTALRSLMSKG